MNFLRKHLSYANVIASLALVFSMSGAAVAANHYLIKSTKQINPKVLKKLKGSRGAQGPVGPQGATGSPNTANFFSKGESDGRYLGKGETAADSTKLAGVAASGYTTGEGSQGGRWIEMVNAAKEENFLFVPGIGELSLECATAPKATNLTLTEHAGSSVFLTWGSYPKEQATRMETAVLTEGAPSLTQTFANGEGGTGQMIIQASAGLTTPVHTYATITVSLSVTGSFCRDQANYTVSQQRF